VSLVSSYLASLTLRGYRPTTIKARRQTLEAFERSVAPLGLGDVTRHHVEEWLSRPLAPESRRTYRAALRSFYGWCLEEGFLHADPTAKVRPIRVPRGVPRPLTDDELSTALALADRRMRCWLLCMALAGLRCMEVAGLEPRDLIDTPNGPVLHLRVTKGGAPATVPAHPVLVESLRQQPVRSGLWWSVNASTLSTQVNRHLRAAGVRGTGHCLRHYAGTAWFRASGSDLLTTAALMRHVKIDTTATYAKLAAERPGEVARSVVLHAV
jgi:integrase